MDSALYVIILEKLLWILSNFPISANSSIEQNSLIEMSFNYSMLIIRIDVSFNCEKKIRIIICEDISNNVDRFPTIN